MKSILMKCTADDFEYLASQLTSYNPLVKDKERMAYFYDYAETPSEENKTRLIDSIYSDLTYYASADFAYLYRKVVKGNGGIDDHELISDVAKKLKINIKPIGSVESKLEKLVQSVVEKAFFEKNPDELAAAFKSMKIGQDQIDEIIEEVRKLGKIVIIPILIKVLGPKVTLKVIEAVVIATIGTIVGREAAKILFREIMKRNPVLNALGPLVWTIFGSWLIFDLQGPAYRKTIPVCLYLGMVGLRDGIQEN